LTIHLHWLWRKGPEAARGVTLGAAACGVRGLKPGQFTSFKDDATCKDCLRVAETQPENVTRIAPPPKPDLRPVHRGGTAEFTQRAAPTKSNFPSNAVITTLVKHNPRKVGSGKHQRMAVLLAHNGKTVKEFLAAGGNSETLKNAVKEKIVEVRHAEQERAT